MSKKSLCFAVVLLTALGLAPLASAQQPIDLRGTDVSSPEPSPGSYKLMPDSPPIQRDYVQQPPLIPHKVEGYEISKNFNRCMDCHSWSRYQETKATKVSLTHFKDRDGGELSNISPRRYFCTQCHVSQTDAQPLVTNTFRRAEGLR